MPQTAIKSPVGLSSSAAARIKALKKIQGNDKLMFRLSVSGGGCSGFQYGFDFVEEKQDDDIIVEKDGVTMLVDNMSLLYVVDSQVDYITDLIGSSFQVINPNAQSSCGCGSSFSI